MENKTFKSVALNFLSRLTSRKWLAPITYGIILIINDAYSLGISETTLTALAGLFGVFQVVEGVKDYRTAQGQLSAI